MNEPIMKKPIFGPPATPGSARLRRPHGQYGQYGQYGKAKPEGTDWNCAIKWWRRIMRPDADFPALPA